MLGAEVERVTLGPDLTYQCGTSEDFLGLPGQCWWHGVTWRDPGIQADGVAEPLP